MDETHSCHIAADNSISEIIGVLLIIILLIAIATIVSAMWFGWAGGLLSRTPYLKVNISAYDIGGDPNNQSIELFHHNGDVLSLQAGGKGTPANITLLLPDGSFANAIPSTDLKSFSPGQFIYISKKAGTPSYYGISSTPPQKSESLMGGKYTVNIIDANTHILLVTQSVTINGQLNPNPTVTTTMTPAPIHYPGFTVETWVKWNQNPTASNNNEMWATIVVDGDSDSNRRYHLQHDMTNSLFEFAIATSVNGGGSGTWIYSTTSPKKDIWYYIAGVYNQTDPGNRHKIYVNGIMENGATSDASGLRSSPNKYQVGSPGGITFNGESNVRKFNGVMGSSLHTYEYVLTDAEIQGHYNNGHP